MQLCAVLAFSLLLVFTGHAQQSVPLTQGMVIDRSITVRPGIYRLSASAGLNTPAITIRGENITVDFNGATVIGSPDTADPDQFAGVGVLIDGGRKVTVRGATIRGYKVGILARNSPDLHLTRNDLSYNWKQRLHSGIEKESLLDWMSYHQNEKDEWLRYGAAIYLRNCDRAEIDHNTAVQGQNGLMVTASKGLKVWNNTFQFLSSIGIGLYRVSESTIMHNRIDWCVRGYSHGYYNRGQDSAGLLMYEQSSNNTVAYNSITHSGDGLFLWAGQSTMDTGQGGANDNLFAANDFSHAPTNGIEATFSSNDFVHNRVEDCWHGVWGGYSFRSRWANNWFARNAEAIAIEHGQDNAILGNQFDGDLVGIRLWQNASQDPNWGYAKQRDTRSRGYQIGANRFRENRTALQISDTLDVALAGDTFEAVGEVLKSERVVPALKDPPAKPKQISFFDTPVPGPLPEGIDAKLRRDARRGRATIIVDEWGPYDWKSPKLWPLLSGGEQPLPYRRLPKSSNAFDGPVKLNVLGPPGTWKVASSRGASISPRSGKVGDVISVTPASGSVIDYDVSLIYVGEEVTSPRGARTPGGKPYTFSYRHFFAPIDWTLNFHSYPESVDPSKSPGDFRKALAAKPVITLKSDRIDYLSGGVLEDGVPRDHFAIVADGMVDLPAGNHELQVISDDGARVWIDGKLAVDAWEPHESRMDVAPLSGGKRRLKVEYYDRTGWAEIHVQIQPRRTRN